MHCKNCEYPLWNISARKCPECGVDFLPSQYQFRPNTVKFCCPHCDQQYFGTDTQGMLFPRAFNCVNCHQPVEMDQMVLRPADGVSEAQTMVASNPWLDRARRGWFKRWWGTVGQALVSPGKLMAATPPGTATGPAWGFWSVTVLIILLASSVQFLCLCAIPMTMGPAGGGGAGNAMLGILGSGIVGLIVGLVLTFIMTGLWGVCTHGLLRLTGQTLGSFGRTYQCICFASGANIMTAVPCFGQYIGGIWWMVSATIATAQGQRVSGGRAAFAVLTPPIVFVATLLGLYALLIYMAMSTVPRTVTVGPGAAVPLSAETATVANALANYARFHSNQLPPHALSLVVSSNMDAGDFISSYTNTQFGEVPAAGVTLDVFARANYSDQSDFARRAAKALPAEVVAYRQGDFVFFCPGLTTRFADGQLWTVLYSPDPDSNPFPSQQTEQLGTANGGTVVVSGGFQSRKSAIDSQNRIRARYSLAPLPADLSVLHAVTHDQPLTAGQLPVESTPQDSADWD